MNGELWFPQVYTNIMMTNSFIPHSCSAMSTYETSPVQPVDDSETTITVVFPNVTHRFIKPAAQVPTEGRGLQEVGPSDPSELVMTSFR